MLTFDFNFKRELYEKALHSPRKRAHHNIHTSYVEPIQRLAIALLSETYIPPHKHEGEHQWEFFNVIEGMLKLIIFSPCGTVTDTKLLGYEDGIFAVQIPPNVIHTLVCMSPKALILEWKEGPFDPNKAKSALDWTIPESDPGVPELVERLQLAVIGDNFSFKQLSL